MEEVLRIDDRCYILATSSRLDDRTRVLKEDETFAIFDRHGDIYAFELGEPGLYHQGTRFLSRLVAELGDGRPLLLSSVVRDDNSMLAVDLANTDLHRDGELVVPANSLHLRRATFLHDGACHQRFHLHNFAARPLDVRLTLSFEADFADIFEIRGTRRKRRGQRLASTASDAAVTLRYRGLDDKIRETHLDFDPAPCRVSPQDAEFRCRLEPHGEAEFAVAIRCRIDESAVGSSIFADAFADATARKSARHTAGAVTPNPQFNAWMARSEADLRMLVGNTPNGRYPYAGVPWYSTVFGRDGIVTALECLWADPDLARGVLAHLAATQASDEIPERDAEPGKIVHEMRDGEMAALGEIPFGRYYGTVDATPLFVVLCGAYWRRTGDREFAEILWPHVERALEWIDRYGDRDHDGFVEYEARTPRGLANQGWKDSPDSVFHTDGSLAEGAIALCEVQGYVEAAKRAAADLAATLGDAGRAESLRAEAARLRTRLDDAFWCEDLGCHAIALDGRKRPCRVRTSNPGHLLFTESIPFERADRLAQTLLDERSFSGWGIRTVASGEPRYNPMSYHNGSIWPHDNALIAAGFARYGLASAASRVAAAMFDASVHIELHRLPELYCGFTRQLGEGPTHYPVACSPQAWAVAAPYLLVEACLGLSIDGGKHVVSLRRPVLPGFIDELTLRDVAVGASTLDLEIRGRGSDVAARVLRKTGPVELSVER